MSPHGENSQEAIQWSAVPGSFLLPMATTNDDFFRARLDQMIDLRHPLAVLATRMPHVRLDVLRQGSTQLVRNLLHGRLDAAIIGTPAMTGDLQITPLHREPLMACLANSHPLARKRQLSLQAIAGEPVFWFERRRNPVYYDHC